MKTGVICAAAALALVGAGARADRIGVRVNDEPVRFSGVGPIETNGRILVPLRGVLEQLGAYVGWDAATQTVVAQRGDLDLRLPIGSRRAWVNGQAVSLDAPARTILGNTMVPLRFVSEALGADVSWDAGNQMVSIDTGGSTPASNAPERRRFAYRSRRNDAAPAVYSVATSLSGDRLASGDSIRVTMRGTPGGKAFFRIRNVVGERVMSEVSPGVYEGRWTNSRGYDLVIDPADILAFVVIGDRSTKEVAPGGSARL